MYLLIGCNRYIVRLPAHVGNRPVGAQAAPATYEGNPLPSPAKEQPASEVGNRRCGLVPNVEPVYSGQRLVSRAFSWAMLDAARCQRRAGENSRPRGNFLACKQPIALNAFVNPSHPKPPAHHPLDALTQGAFSAPTSGERAARIRQWLAGGPSPEELHQVFKELSGRDKGAAKPVREKLDELKRAKGQESLAGEWVNLGQIRSTRSTFR